MFSKLIIINLEYFTSPVPVDTENLLNVWTGVERKLAKKKEAKSDYKTAVGYRFQLSSRVLSGSILELDPFNNSKF